MSWDTSWGKVKEAIKSSRSVDEACQAVSKIRGFWVSWAAIRAAWRRRESGSAWNALSRLKLPTQAEAVASYATAKFTGGSILCTGDVHYPIQDKRVEAAIIAFARDMKPSVWVDVGDRLDCWLISRYEKEAGQLFKLGEARLQEEIDAQREATNTLCGLVRQGHWIIGNHEQRLERLVNSNPGLYGLESLQWPKLLSAPANLEIHPYRTTLQLADLPLCFEHGDAIKSSRSPAAWVHQRLGLCNLVFGHYHRMQSYYHTFVGPFGRKDYVAHSQGCGIDFTKVMYWAPREPWQHGFSYVETYTVAGEPRFSIYPVCVVDGKFSFGGKVYDGSKWQ